MTPANQDHFIFVTRCPLTKKQAAKINREVKKIDPSAAFHGPLRIPGETLTGWAVRPNDRKNDTIEGQARNSEIRLAVEKILSE